MAGGYKHNRAKTNERLARQIVARNLAGGVRAAEFTEGFGIGVLVTHPQYGKGRVSGCNSKKKTIRVEFFRKTEKNQTEYVSPRELRIVT